MNHVTLSVRLLMLAVVNVGVIAASHVQIATHLDHTIGLTSKHRMMKPGVDALYKSLGRVRIWRCAPPKIWRSATTLWKSAQAQAV